MTTQRTARTVAVVILMSAGLAVAGTTHASAAETQAHPNASSQRAGLPAIDPIGAVDTIYDTIEDPFGQVYNTAVGLTRAIFGQKLG